MLKKPTRIYSDFENAKERRVVIADLKKSATANVRANVDPNWTESRRILHIRGEKAFRELARRSLEGIKKEDKLMAEYERQKKKLARKSNQKKSKKA